MKTISFARKNTGISLIDSETPVSFGVGFLAGASGLNPTFAAFSVVAFKAILVALEKGSAESAFTERVSQTYGNKAVDLLVALIGIHYGTQYNERKGMSGVLTYR